MSKCALLTIVRNSKLEDSATRQVDYAAGLEQHDEIELTDAYGEPCATPIQMPDADLDYKYNYADGSTGRQLRTSQSSLVLSCDFLRNNVRRRLEQWKHERAEVLFTPGFGRHTDFAWRPYPGVGTKFPDGTDLTDLLGTTIEYDQFEFMGLWDEIYKLLRTPDVPVSIPDLLIMPTKYGAGYGSADDDYNRWSPASPKSATEGFGAADAGWEKSGTDAGQITFAFVANGFGQTNVPGSLHVTTTNAVSSSRSIEAKNLWDSGDAEFQGYSWTGSGTAEVVVWLRGRFPGGATLNFFQVGGNSDSAILSDLDLSDWTPIQLRVNSNDWTTGLPTVFIDLSAATYGDQADFEIGPFNAYQTASRHAGIGAKRSTHGAAIGDCFVTVPDYDMTPAGTILFSVFIPDDFQGVADARIGLMGTTARHFLVKTGLADAWAIEFDDGTVHTATWTAGPTYGKINTFAYQFSTKYKAIYANGLLVESWATEEDQDSQIGGVADVLIGEDKNDYRTFPALIMSCRFDRVVHSEIEMAYLHSQLADNGSIESIVKSRGRIYEIVDIPSIPRIGPNGFDWLGNIVLRQKRYDPNFLDITNRETMIL